MQDTARAAVQEWFLASHTGIIVATIAFGMGVDKANIRYVYHYNLPKSLENYAQEIGRAGRDDATSICQMFVSLDDMNLLENFVYGDTPTLSAIRSLLDGLFSLHEEFDVSYYELSIRPCPASTIIPAQGSISVSSACIWRARHRFSAPSTSSPPSSTCGRPA